MLHRATRPLFSSGERASSPFLSESQHKKTGWKPVLPKSHQAQLRNYLKTVNR